MGELNDMQKQAVEHLGSPLLILAGAGSGKTRVITHKIASLVESGVFPSRILAVTFTNKAAGEMRERVRSLATNMDMGSGWIGTFHSVCLRMLKANAEKAGLRSGFVIYDRDDQLALVKELFRDFGRETKRSDLYEFINKVSRSKQDSLDYNDPLIWSNETEYEMAMDYERRLSSHNAVDFDNIIKNTVAMLRDHEEVRMRYRNHFEYILVDEYQDTNRIQFEFINILAGGTTHLCVVGDEDQSIYSWRGATIKNIIDFEKKFPDTKIIKLEQNYRSTSTILNAANCVISNNVNRKGKRLWTSNVPGDPIDVISSYNREEEGIRIVSLLKKEKKRFEYSQMAVFVRTNAQTREVENALRRASIPYKVIGSLKFYDRKEVRDLLAYLKVMNNPSDSVNLLRIVNTPKRGIGRKSAEEIVEVMNRGHDFYHVCREDILSPSVRKKAAELEKILKAANDSASKEGLGESLEELLRLTDYRHYIESEFENPEERWGNVLELVNDLREFSASSDSALLSDYLNEVSLLQDIDMLGNDSDAVNLLTLHKAKGLEYDMVVLAGCEEGTMPHKNSMYDLYEMEEERRLFYVGMTRANRNLVLSWAKNIPFFGYGKYEPAIRSRFLEEIPAEYLKTQEIRPALAKNRAAGTRMFMRIKSGTVIIHDKYGRGRVIATKFKNYVVDFNGELKEIESDSSDFRVE